MLRKYRNILCIATRLTQISFVPRLWPEAATQGSIKPPTSPLPLYLQLLNQPHHLGETYLGYLVEHLRYGRRTSTSQTSLRPRGLDLRNGRLDVRNPPTGNVQIQSQDRPKLLQGEIEQPDPTSY
jgi:hypothetical protein